MLESRSESIRADTDADVAVAERVLVGRYVLGVQIGIGGFGTVHRALDRLTGEAVAVKLMQGLGEQALARVRREVAALRLLRLPGVVHLLDEGEDGADRFLVMELVEGDHFPAGRRDWPRLAPTVLGLLEALGRVHAAGVVHRDLKPANVLVGQDGRPTILDFGISRGEPVGTTITGEGALVGTPGYLAPEQILGQRADVRSDLYAVGVMLFEALAGRSPHPGPGAAAIMQARVVQVPPALARLAPQVPAEVAHAVDRLLAIQPEQRPASAAELIALLSGDGAVAGADLPWLGDSALLSAATEAVRAGQSVAIAGPPGSGRTRALREIGKRLTAEGETVLWLRPSREPFGSLGELRPSEECLRSLDLAAAAAAVQAHLPVAAGQTVVLADDWERLDRWSVAALVSVSPRVRVIRAVTRDVPEALRLSPLGEVALRPLFQGQQRLLHVPEDAARLLQERTGGLPRAVRAEIEAWVRAGLATWDEGRVAMTRAAVDRLASALPVQPGADADLAAAHGDTWVEAIALPAEVRADPYLAELLAWLHLAWPHAAPAVLARAMAAAPWQVQAGVEQLVQLGAARVLADGRVEPRTGPPGWWTAEQLVAAHGALARVLPAGADRRLFHLVAAGAGDAVAQEAIALARGLLQQGRLGQAEAILTESLRVVRREAQSAFEAELLGLLVQVAWAAGSVRALDIARYEVQRTRLVEPAAAGLCELVDVALAAMRAGGDAVLDRAEAIPPFADEALDAVRQAVRKHAARACALARDEAVVADIAAWAVARGTESARAHAASFMARLRYRQGRYEEAAALDLAAARGDALPLHLRLTTLTYGASALQSAFRYAEAHQIATEALALADAGRLVPASARAEWILRATAYRSGLALQPDVELVTAVVAAGLSHLAVAVLLTEATIAWRSGQLATCADLAADGMARAEALRMEPFASVLALLRAVADPGTPGFGADEVVARAEATGDPEVALQMYGLAALALAQPQPAWQGLALRHATALAAVPREQRLDLLSPAEAMHAVAHGQLPGTAGVS